MIQNDQLPDYDVDAINDTGNENGECDWEELLVKVATNHWTVHKKMYDTGLHYILDFLLLLHNGMSYWHLLYRTTV